MPSVGKWLTEKWSIISWWRHQMETFSALLARFAGNSPVAGEFPAQRPVMGIFNIFFDLPLNERLSKQSWGRWFETSLCPLWRHCNVRVNGYWLYWLRFHWLGGIISMEWLLKSHKTLLLIARWRWTTTWFCVLIIVEIRFSFQRRHNGCDGVSNHQPHHCLPNRLFRGRSK